MTEENRQPAANQRLVIHPICLALYHVFVLYALYEERTPIDAIFRPVIAVIVLTTALYVALRWWMRDKHKAGVFTSIVILAGLTGWTSLEYAIRTFQPLLGTIPVPYVLYGGAALLAIGASWFFFRDTAPDRARKLAAVVVIFAIGNAITAELVLARVFDRGEAFFISTYLWVIVAVFWAVNHYVADYASLTSSLNRFGGILIVLSVFVVALYIPRVEKLSAIGPAGETEVDTPAPNAPDIYFIALGGYAHTGVLQSLYGFDNSAFLNDLQRIGFVGVDFSMANYVSPVLSIASCMNMEYLQDLITDPAVRNNATLLTVGELFHRNRVYAFLHHRGYEIVACPSGLELLEPRPGTVTALRPRGYVNEFETALLESTCATRVVHLASSLGLAPAGDFQSIRERHRVRFIFESLQQIPAQRSDRPRFVLAAVGLPEAPFLFTRDGLWNRETFLRSYKPGESFRGSKRAYIEAYLEQLEFTNAMLTKSIQAILNANSRPAVIVLASLNGPRSQRQGRDRTQIDILEEFANFVAVYFPPEFRDEFAEQFRGRPLVLEPDARNDAWQKLTLVNLFRRVFNVVFDAGLEPREDNLYQSSDDKPLVFQQINVSRPPVPAAP